MKTCKKCRAELEDEVRFCTKCGAQNDDSPEQTSDVQEFTFQKGKMMGNVTYKRTKTKVLISATSITVEKAIKKLFRKEKEEKRTLLISQIPSARMHVVLDFWDTLYAIACAVLGVFQPSLFLLAAVCLWCGYGREIEILTTEGNKVKIPLTREKNEAEQLVAICNRQM